METILEIVNMLDLKDDEGCQEFNTKDLIPFLEGRTEYKNNTCDDKQYEYTLNFDHQIFSGKGYDSRIEEDVIRSLSFEQIRSGIKLSDSIVPAFVETMSVDRVLEMFMKLPKEMKEETFEKIRRHHEFWLRLRL